MTTCPACGRENPPASRFCNSCGAALGAEAPAAREERKVVTVLFCDLVGFTSRAEQLDPEDVRAVLGGYHERLRRELERFGGTVEKFIGDAVMALFGAPVAHEDDPERAVRAALAIRDELAEPADGSVGRGLRVRIGITTGEALVNLSARPEAGEAMAAGDVVNTAARLQSAAPVDGILVDETTFRATERAVSYEPAAPVEAKGKAEPVPVWTAVDARARLGLDVARTAPTELVGRGHELDVLRDALGRARREQAVQLVTLVGVPGIGKSRLVHELLRIVDEDPELISWRQGRSLPYGEQASFWALGEMVKAQAGILETDDDETAAAKLHEAVETLLGDAEDRLWVERQLRPLAGLGRAEGTGESSVDESFAAWRRFLEALGESGPAVLVFEDLHWADEGLLDFVDHLVDWATGVPLLVVCTARPELFSRRSGWGGGKPNATTLSLAPLTDEDTARLVARLADRALMPAEVQAALLERAGGNPLYAEEFVRMAAERGDPSAVGAAPLPETVQGIIAARLDGLEPEAKALLQDAAVLGKVFWLGGVAEIGGRERWEVERHLHELERRQLVRRERRSTVAGELEYAFWHALVRDVAYGQIPRAARADKHRAAAEWIGSLATDRAADRANLLAHHYLSALELARAAGRDTGSLERPARLALRVAGEQALALNAYEPAIRFFEEALALWPHDDPDRAQVLFGHGRALYAGTDGGWESLVEARDAFVAAGNAEDAATAETMLASVAWMAGRPAEAIPHVERAAALLAHRPPSFAQAYVHGNLARYLMLAGSRDEDALRVGREALAMAEKLGEEELVAAALNNVGTIRTNMGDRGGLADLERSIEICARIASPEAIRGYINLASTTGTFGDMRRCAELHERGLEVARRFGQERGIRFLTGDMPLDRFLLGDWDAAWRLAGDFLANIEAGRPHYMEGAARGIRAAIAVGRDDVHFAIPELEQSLAHARRLNEPQALLPTLSTSSLVFADAGRPDRARALVDELLGDEAIRAQAFYWAIPAAVQIERLGRSDELARAIEPFAGASRWAEAGLLYATARFSEAADVLHEIGDLVTEAHARLRAAEALAAEGRRAEADAELRRAVDFFRSVAATRYLRRAEGLLAAAS